MVYGCCHRVPSRIALRQWNICFPSASCMYCCRSWLTVTIMPIRLAMENMFLYRKPNSNHRKGSGAYCQLNSHVKYPASSSYHIKILVFKTAIFCYWRNLLQQQGIIAVHSYIHYNATHTIREKMGCTCSA